MPTAFLQVEALVATEAVPEMAIAGGSDATAPAAAHSHRFPASHPYPRTAVQAVAAAAAEGLTLVRGDIASGFRCVSYKKRINRYVAHSTHNRERLGCFLSPEEVALCISRWLCDLAQGDKTALVAAASVQVSEAAAVAPAAAEDAALTFFARSQNGAVAGELTLPVPDASARTVAAAAAVRLNLPSPYCVTGRKRAHERAAICHQPYLAPGSGDV